jgi:hypothetical protein
MYCCDRCFGDKGITNIFPSKTSVIGRCSYCDSDDVLVIDPAELRDLFAAVVNIYEVDEGGKPLCDWMREDWALFRNPRIDSFRAQDLLAAITGKYDLPRLGYSPSPRFQSDRLVRWSQLTDELRNTNRYFPKTELDKVRLEELLEFLEAESMPVVWYRARIQSNHATFSIDEMGAPPRHLASHGRANPPGIPYLYLASTPETAVAEIRPHTGERITIADFTVDTGSLNLVDLRNPKELISPFEVGGEDVVGALRGDVQFLSQLGTELTRPVLPQGAAVEYVPSQYLCEFIKNAGWHGVVYRSSISDGINLALFNAGLADAGNVHAWTVKRVSVETHPI